MKIREDGKYPKKTIWLETSLPDFSLCDVIDFKLDLDRKNKIMSFREIGMINPMAKSMKKEFKGVEEEMKLLLFDDKLYKDAVISVTKPPKSIFLPNRALVRSMIYMVI